MSREVARWLRLTMEQQSALMRAAYRGPEAKSIDKGWLLSRRAWYRVWDEAPADFRADDRERP